MAMMVQGSDGIGDEALPVAELAASLRLPDGYDAVPEQLTRLRARLRAAIVAVEARTGKILVARDVTVQGAATGGLREPLPVAPVAAVLSVTVQRGAATIDLGAVAVEPQVHRPIAVLPQAVQAGASMTVTLSAGYSTWMQVPAPLREAVILLAQGLDAATDVDEVVGSLIAPYRPLRIGGAV